MTNEFCVQVQGMHSDVATMRQTSIWREASRIVYEEGFRAFWKGNLVTIAHWLPYSSISFYAYERYKTVSSGVRGINICMAILSCMMICDYFFV
jgi:solute carrier family 25 (mitochondrial phosphate transporter), member 23/24/25/41